MPAPRPHTPGPPTTAPRGTRAELVADTAIALLAERGLRGLTHRAVDAAAGLPEGSTSNQARTRAALLEAALRRLADREARMLTGQEMPTGHGGAAELAEMVALALRRYLTGDRDLLVARYELALESTRRPELRALYVRTGTAAFRQPVEAMLTAAGSPDPSRHALSLVAWCDGVLFSCVAGSFRDAVPDEAALRASLDELLRGMLG